MKEKSCMDLYLSANALFKRMIDLGEWFIILLIGFLFPYPKIPFSPFTNIIGLMLLILGIWIHSSSHKIHRQAHQPKEQIEALVTTGIYSKIRHPGYTAYMICYLGILFLFGFLSMLIPIIIFSYLFYDSAVKEEKFLREKFGKQYEDYMKKVPWRFIPYLF